MNTNIPVVILAGGLGTRLREETDIRPKPMVTVGNQPVLWHIMKTYAHYGFRRFIICLGYKGEVIKDYFLRSRLHHADFTINTRSGNITEHVLHGEDWDVTLVDTGLDCQTGGRLARVARYIDTDRFFLTYGDGIADVDINHLLKFHEAHGKMATLTAVKSPARFGNLEMNGSAVQAFKEKHEEDSTWINGGFFVFEKSFLDTLTASPSLVLEKEPLRNAAQLGQLSAYHHFGFWQCMDTIKERVQLEQLWESGAPWKVWDHTNTFGSEHEEVHGLRPVVRESELC